jgi:Holliday junction DNA helicase RuvA
VISYVRGPVAAVGASAVVVDVGGIGLELFCSPTTLSRLHVGQQATVSARMIVREDSLTLYGFSDDDERDVFDVLQTVSGVGPRLGLAILASLTPDQIRLAVATEDLVALTRVPGVGRKGAQRMVLELKDRLGPAVHVDSHVAAAAASQNSWQPQVHAALIGLGWNVKDAETAIAAVAADSDDNLDVGTALRLSLQRLDRG